MDSSTWLRRSIASLSTTSTPALSANRLARPVKARSTRTPAPATAAAISGAPPPPDPPPGPRAELVLRQVLRHVAGLDPRHHDLGNAGSLQGGDLRLADQGAFLQNEAA